MGDGSGVFIVTVVIGFALVAFCVRIMLHGSFDVSVVIFFLLSYSLYCAVVTISG